MSKREIEIKNKQQETHFMVKENCVRAHEHMKSILKRFVEIDSGRFESVHLLCIFLM